MFNHSNSITATTTIPTTSINNLKYDAQGHITGTSSVTGDTTNGIQIVDSKIKHTNVLAAANTTSGLKYFTYDKNGHVTAAVNKTLGRGISDASNVIGHSNTAVTALTTQALHKIAYDAYGHITGSTAVAASDITPLVSVNRGLDLTSSNIGHTNAVTANTTSGLKYFTYDAQGHVNAATNKTLGRGISDNSNVIGHSNTAVTAVTTAALAAVAYDTYGHITSSTAKTLGRGISDSSNVIGHSNTAITAATLNNNTTTVSDWSTAATYGVIVSQAPYDTYGHITGKTDRTYTIGQSDWNNNTTTAFPYVRNRPNIRLNGQTGGGTATGTIMGYIAGNTASGNYSTAMGQGTTATIVGATARGVYNNTTKADAANLNLIDMVGIGTSTAKKNAMAVTMSGDLRIKGNVYVGCNDDSTGGTIAGGAKHYGTCILPAHAKGTVNVTPVFEDTYQLDGTEHPVLDLVPTSIDTVESELSI